MSESARARVGRRRERGVVLALVLVIGLLLMTVVIGFSRRSIVDFHIARNRDAAAQADALARGGVQLATFLLLADELAGDAAPPGDTYQDVWAQAENYEIATEDGGRLRVRVRDEGSRLDVNAVVPENAAAEASEEAVDFLIAVLEKVIDELPIAPGERVFDARELAYNLIDYIDSDEERQRGGPENAWYERQSPPYEAANQPLRSVEELAMVEGFTPVLVDGLRPYLTVHPRKGGGGINLNTAPPHVLSLVYHGSLGSRTLASEDTVRRILRAREEGKILCATVGEDDRCILASEIVEGSVFPESSLPTEAALFRVEAEATVGDIRRTVSAVVDRTDPAQPTILEWRHGS